MTARITPAHIMPIHIAPSECFRSQVPLQHACLADKIVIGVDEVGRGSLFGQMTVCAVIMPTIISCEFGKIALPQALATLNDSKKLTAKKRDLLNTAIRASCHSFVLMDISADIIDNINIHQATLLGMRLAIEHLIIHNQLSPTQTHIAIDGNAKPQLATHFFEFLPNMHTHIKGDGNHISIACASILAKVHRDAAISKLAKTHAHYGLETHKGYPTYAHLQAIKEHGILPKHRKSYAPIKTLLAKTLPFNDE